MQKVFILIVVLTSLSFGQGCEGTSQVQAAPAEDEQHPQKSECGVNKILDKLSEQTEDIKTYRCELVHISRQPLFDSQTVRRGKMFYYRDKGQSLLRVDFETIRQDNQPSEEYKERFIFDGVWLTRIDYQLKEVKKYQLVDVNEIKQEQKADAFNVITEHLPIVGFTGEEKLKKEFEIALADANEPNEFIKLHLEVKPDSVYKDNWVWIDFWIDKQMYLPAKVVTLTTEKDIFEIQLIDAVVNEPMAMSLFEVQVPEGFVEAEVVPLKKNNDAN